MLPCVMFTCPLKPLNLLKEMDCAVWLHKDVVFDLSLGHIFFGSCMYPQFRIFTKKSGEVTS